MRYRTLGRSGAVVSTQCLGTMTFGSEADETTSGEILGAFVERGGTLVDTADVYGSGVSEEIIGRWLAKHPTEAAQWSSPRRAASPWGTGPTTSGSRAVTCAGPSTTHCAASTSTTSTSTRCTPGTR